MKPNPKYQDKDSSFWAYVKLLSEKLGYSKNGRVIFHDRQKAIDKLTQLNINIEYDILDETLDYLKYRAELLNSKEEKLMDVEEAKALFMEYKQLYDAHDFTCDLPMNKQKREKKDHAFFTGIINIITEKTIRKFAEKHNLEYGIDIGFNDDPHSLAYVLSNNMNLEGIFSRRFDGAFPDVDNAHLIWEIKEYYYTTSFGSRISDGVYETQLDGFEAKKINEETGVFVKHVYMIDSHRVWWIDGKSYLCRIVDMMNMGLADEVLLGKEVIERWSIIVKETLEYYKDNFIKNSIGLNR